MENVPPLQVCDICNVTYPSVNDLENHLIDAHPELAELLIDPTRIQTRTNTDEVSLAMPLQESNVLNNEQPTNQITGDEGESMMDLSPQQKCVVPTPIKTRVFDLPYSYPDHSQFKETMSLPAGFCDQTLTKCLDAKFTGLRFTRRFTLRQWYLNPTDFFVFHMLQSKMSENEPRVFWKFLDGGAIHEEDDSIIVNIINNESLEGTTKVAVGLLFLSFCVRQNTDQLLNLRDFIDTKKTDYFLRLLNQIILFNVVVVAKNSYKPEQFDALDKTITSLIPSTVRNEIVDHGVDSVKNSHSLLYRRTISRSITIILLSEFSKDKEKPRIFLPLLRQYYGNIVSHYMEHGFRLMYSSCFASALEFAKLEENGTKPIHVTAKDGRLLIHVHKEVFELCGLQFKKYWDLDDTCSLADSLNIVDLIYSSLNARTRLTITSAMLLGMHKLKAIPLIILAIDHEYKFQDVQILELAKSCIGKESKIDLLAASINDNPEWQMHLLDTLNFTRFEQLLKSPALKLQPNDKCAFIMRWICRNNGIEYDDDDIWKAKIPEHHGLSNTYDALFSTVSFSTNSSLLEHIFHHNFVDIHFAVSVQPAAADEDDDNADDDD